MNRTKIEWVKNPNGTQGFTWNPITGCLNGCEYCYARKLANGRLKSRYLANKCIAPIGTMIAGAAMNEKALKDPFYPRFWEDRLNDFGKPDTYGYQAVNKPKGIFVCDMSDWCGVGIPEAWSNWIIEMARRYPELRYLLTKQPQNLPAFSPFPDNCWVGVTATDAKMARNALHELLRIEAKVKYISFEPLLERIYIDCAVGIDWVIIGSQTKPYKPPKIRVQEIVEACDKAGMRVFLKDNLKPLLGDNPNFWDYHTGEWLRQEIPVEIPLNNP